MPSGRTPTRTPATRQRAGKAATPGNVPRNGGGSDDGRARESVGLTSLLPLALDCEQHPQSNVAFGSPADSIESRDFANPPRDGGAVSQAMLTLSFAPDRTPEREPSVVQDTIKVIRSRMRDQRHATSTKRWSPLVDDAKSQPGRDRGGSIRDPKLAVHVLHVGFDRGGPDGQRLGDLRSGVS